MQAPGGSPPDSPPPAAPAATPAADGGIRLLDPRFIALNRTVGAAAGIVISGVHLIGSLIMWLIEGGAWALLMTLTWVPMTALLVWLAVRWPYIDYRHWRYRIDTDGIEIWSGVYWRERTTVPRSRVQHIDVSQGPLERSYGLATLSVYTAGTAYSKLDLPGLDHADALALRDALLPKDAEPAV